VAEHATERVVISATPDRCFAVSADLGAYPRWAADIKEVIIDARDEQGRPQLVTFRAAAFGRSTNYTLSYDYSQAPNVLAWVLTEGDITSKLDGRYVFEPTGDGSTQVTYHLEVELKVPLPGFIKMRAQSRIMSIALRDLKARVESTA
jgi:ribosome-associated toxin RatA of RatAB toxin-antitoxin module